MTEGPFTTVMFISPGGVVTRPFADGHATMRSCLGHLEADDGVLKEMTARSEPIPWESEKIRDNAVRSIERRGDLAEDVRAELLEWVSASPYYET